MWKQIHPGNYSDDHAENPDTFGKGLSRRTGAALDCRYVQAHAKRRRAVLSVYDRNHQIVANVNASGVFYGLRTASFNVYQSRQLLAVLMETRLNGAAMTPDTLRNWIRSIRATRLAGDGRKVAAA